jgi:hypothetical protein
MLTNGDVAVRSTAPLITLTAALVASLALVPPAGAESTGDIKIKKVVVNGGKNVVIGTKLAKKITIRITFRDNSGIKSAYFDPMSWQSGLGIVEPDEVGVVCTASSKTTSVCTQTFIADPKLSDQNPDDYSVTGLMNRDAGKWQLYAEGHARDGNYLLEDTAGWFYVKRASRLTATTTVTTVRRGSEIKIKGKLTRANWERRSYRPYTKQKVRLQFKKAGTSSYRTVKTVKSGSKGGVSATVTVSAAGSWRWYFPATTTTAHHASAALTPAWG